MKKHLSFLLLAFPLAVNTSEGRAQDRSRESAVHEAVLSHLLQRFCLRTPCRVVSIDGSIANDVLARLKKRHPTLGTDGEKNHRGRVVFLIRLGMLKWESPAGARVTASVSADGLTFDHCEYTAQRKGDEWRVQDDPSSCSIL